MPKPCYGCLKPEHGDRVRDSSGQLGYGTLWCLDAAGAMAFVAFGCRTVDISLSRLEFVSRKEAT